jgi:hypothetical protein
MNIRNDGEGYTDAKDDFISLALARHRATLGGVISVGLVHECRLLGASSVSNPRSDGVFQEFLP